MTKFSDRYGYTKTEKAFQRESIDLELRTKLWNMLKVSIWDDHGKNSAKTDRIDMLVKRLWFHYFNADLDQFPGFWDYYSQKGAYTALKEHFFSCEWYEVYNFLEELAEDATNLLTSKTCDWINSELEKHNSAYRFVGESIAEITRSHLKIASTGSSGNLSG